MSFSEIPTTLLEAVRYFSDLSVCNDYMRRIKWPRGKIVCPKCGNDSCHELATRPGTLKCNKAACQKQFSAKVGTLMEDSAIPLSGWFVGIFVVANDIRVSSARLADLLGITQRSAWSMMTRIHAAKELI